MGCSECTCLFQHSEEAVVLVQIIPLYQPLNELNLERNLAIDRLWQVVCYKLGLQTQRSRPLRAEPEFPSRPYLLSGTDVSYIYGNLPSISS